MVDDTPPPYVTFSQRMPRPLHELATGMAKCQGTNLTAYVNRAVQVAVSRDETLSAPDQASGNAEYEITMRFRIDDDGAADDRARRLLAQMSATAELVGGRGVAPEIKRLAPMA
jgi:hypothetical protein